MLATMVAARCLLFFPGTRPELLSKGVATGAGVVCADLEDSVAPDDKAAARGAVIELLASPDRPPEMAVRVNHPRTPEGAEDLRALAGLEGPAELVVMIPKVAGPRDVERVGAALDTDGAATRLLPVIETARGLHAVESIAEAEGVTGILFGALDLSTELGCELAWDTLLHARSRCVVAARLGGVELLDSPFFDVEDADGLGEEARQARRLGFTGKAAIHPSQVGVIHDVFRPTEEELERARRVVAASDDADAGVFLLDGLMVDRPVVEAARRLLARSPEENADPPYEGEPT